MAVLWFHLAIMFVAPNHLEADSEQLWGELLLTFHAWTRMIQFNGENVWKRMKTYEYETGSW